MGMTLTQKILAAHAGLAEVKAGQLINAKLDIVLGNDITTPVAINEFEKAGFDGVFDKEHIAIVLDHFVPNKDIKSATQSKQCREFANKYDILNFYDVGQMGIEHALLPEHSRQIKRHLPRLPARKRKKKNWLKLSSSLKIRRNLMNWVRAFQKAYC